MATFDEAQVTSLCRILGTNSDRLDQHLTYHAQVITDADKTAVVADIAAFEAIEDDDTRLTPMSGNRGVDIDPDRQRARIRRRIAVLLHAEDFTSGSGSQIDCIRG